MPQALAARAGHNTSALSKCTSDPEWRVSLDCATRACAHRPVLRRMPHNNATDMLLTPLMTAA
eukprot:9089715-Alexandrium_andersonii.AAC.1